MRKHFVLKCFLNDTFNEVVAKCILNVVALWGVYIFFLCGRTNNVVCLLYFYCGLIFLIEFKHVRLRILCL
jgi:hypothetical protein